MIANHGGVFLNVRGGQMEQSKPPNENHATVAEPACFYLFLVLSRCFLVLKSAEKAADI